MGASLPPDERPSWHGYYMTEVTLQGHTPDGEFLLLQDQSGQELRLPLNDELRRAVRQGTLQQASSGVVPAPKATISPREIQQRIRAGLSAAELAELTGEPISVLERFEAPIIAERQYIVTQAQSTRIGREASAPTLADLVTDRLATRKVDTSKLVWDAWRELGEPWQVAVDFKLDGKTLRARWSFDHTAGSLTGEDDEARWLTETELLDAPVARRHLAPLHTNLPNTDTPIPSAPVAGTRADEAILFDQSEFAADATALGGAATDDESAAGGTTPLTTEISATEVLLNDLSRARGQREPLDIDDEPDPVAEALTEDNLDDFRSPSAAHPATAARQQNSGASRKPRKGRASVPSWDEIVFGAPPSNDSED